MLLVVCTFLKIQGKQGFVLVYQQQQLAATASSSYKQQQRQPASYQ